MKRPLIGILTWRKGHVFLEPDYFRQLVREGHKLGTDVCIFSPGDVLIPGSKIRGFIPAAKGGWGDAEFAWPDVVIDRYRNLRPASDFQRYVQFRDQAPFLFTNQRLGDKLRVYEILKQEPRLKKWLPETVAFNLENLFGMLARHKMVYIKPSNGTGGRGILKVIRQEQGYRLAGRDMTRAIKAAKLRTDLELTTWVRRWVGNKKFLIQKGLQLNLVPGCTADIRLLIQKDETGQWDITGLGMRVGGKQSATSNLHGGGTAAQAEMLLHKLFGIEKTRTILQKCRELAFQVAERLESHYGKMLEFGIDIGIDTDGQVWLIEVNPKPGREIFRKLGWLSIYKEAVRRPLKYALYLQSEQKEASPK